jgi:hypothetical protein
MLCHAGLVARHSCTLLLVALVTITVLGGCGASPRPVSQPSVAPSSPAPPGPTALRTATPDASPVAPAPEWVVGARELPLRPDGFGAVLPTPEVLTVRDLPTRDLLPPPTSGRYESTIEPVPPDVLARST